MRKKQNFLIQNKRKLIIVLLVLLIIIVSVFISKNMTKNQKNGNNMNSQEIVDNLLNLSSYKAKVKVQVNSNKNKNKYILWQEYNSEHGCIQEVIEPENIAGVKIIKKDNNLRIENCELDLKTIFENYNGLEDNSLDLINFISEYKQNESNFEEKNEEIIMKTKSNKENRYLNNKILYINKQKNIPIKLVIQDNNQNTTINIEYIEIQLK